MSAHAIHQIRQTMSVSRLCLVPVFIDSPELVKEEVLVFSRMCRGRFGCLHAKSMVISLEVLRNLLWIFW